MASGKYRMKRTWSDSREWGTHEELLAEGEARGRGWAVVRRWRPNPRCERERGESYVLRIDISEWYEAYGRAYTSGHGQSMHDALNFAQVACRLAGICLDNRSPGWWDDGFSRQLCVEATLFKYKSDEDRLLSVAATGRDWDTVDHGALAADVLGALGRLFEVFSSMSEPLGPGDDF